jgi:hypothetical protein
MLLYIIKQSYLILRKVPSSTFVFMPAQRNLFGINLKIQPHYLEVLARKDLEILKEKRCRWNFDFIEGLPVLSKKNVFFWEEYFDSPQEKIHRNSSS